MIVADTNLIAYLLLGGAQTPEARMAFQKDSQWAAPLLWRSEFRSVLALHLRAASLALPDALEVMTEAEALLAGAEYQVDSRRVLRLVTTSRCSAYDCEFVALAQELGAPLVTSDARVLEEFPETAVSPRAFASA